jgi:hypothetical protein
MLPAIDTPARGYGDPAAQQDSAHDGDLRPGARQSHQGRPEAGLATRPGLIAAGTLATWRSAEVDDEPGKRAGVAGCGTRLRYRRERGGLPAGNPPLTCALGGTRTPNLLIRSL